MHFYIFVPQFSFFESLFLLLDSHSSIFIPQFSILTPQRVRIEEQKLRMVGMRIEKCTIIMLGHHIFVMNQHSF